MKKHNTKPYLSVVIFSLMAIFFLIATLALLGCDKDIHDEPKSGNGFLSVTLIWEKKFDSGDEIDSVNLWIYDKTGALAIDKKYTSASELTLQKYEIAAGNVLVVIGVNVVEPIEETHTSTPEDLKFELARQATLYEPTYYGDKTAEVVNGESRAVYIPLHDRPHDEACCERCGTLKPDLNSAFEHNYLCGTHACVEGIVADEHKAAACGSEGHFVCDTKDHTTELDCGHMSCAEGNHEGLDCGHFACSEGNHERLACSDQHWACDKEYGVQDCGHCSCENRHYICPTCGNKSCDDFEYPHEEFYCGHILCGENMEEGHVECEYCGDCVTYGTHGASGCQPPQE